MDSPTVAIAGREIGEGRPCFLVAEVGSNHEGNLDLALNMIRDAKMAGADAVKFQSFLADELVPRRHPDYDYLKKTEMPKEWYPRLRAAGEINGIIVFSTASNATTLGWMAELDFPCYKIASGNLTHLPLIEQAAALGKPLILSTGYADVTEIWKACDTAHRAGNSQHILLHCVGNYPAFPEEVNLRAMGELRAMFPVPVGYSDHTQGVEACMAAAAMGAHVIEKHITNSKWTPGGDHNISADFLSFAQMARFVRGVEIIRGKPVKELGAREMSARASARRVLYAARDIQAGETIYQSMVLYLRPDGRTESMTGKPYDLAPVAIRWVVGRKARRNVPAQSPIHWQDVEIEVADAS